MKKSNAINRPISNSEPTPEMNSTAAEKLQKAARLDIKGVYEMLDSSPDGITEETAKNRISTYGLNEVDYDKAPAWHPIDKIICQSIHRYTYSNSCHLLFDRCLVCCPWRRGLENSDCYCGNDSCKFIAQLFSRV